MQVFIEFYQDIVPAMVFPVFAIFCLLLFFIYYIKISRPERGTTEWIEMRVASSERRLSILNTRYSITVTDVLPLCLITAVFIALAVINIETTTIGLSAGTGSQAVRTNPPLGETILNTYEIVFAKSAHGRQLTGAVIGALMLPVMYVFVKNIFGKTSVAICATLLLGMETSRLTISRTGDIHILAGLFILLSYLFMYWLVTVKPGTSFSKSVVPMALSGLFFALAVAVSWMGLFAGIGLFIIFFIRLIQLGLYTDNKGDELKKKKSRFRPYFIKTMLSSVLFFILIPAVIYFFSYISMKGDATPWSSTYLNMIIADQKAMLQYHLTLPASANQTSVWQQMIYIVYPVIQTNTDAATFGIFGNPIIIWGGLFAMLAMIYRIAVHRDGKALIILLGYIPGILSWIIFPREQFILHYIPSMIFIILAISHLFDTMHERKKAYRQLFIYGFTGLTGLAFVVFYPKIVISELPDWYIDIFTKWLPG